MKTKKTGNFIRVSIFDDTIPQNCGSMWITAIETNNKKKARDLEEKYKNLGYSTSSENLAGEYYE